MRLVLFSTRTKHHYYFIQKLHKKHDISQVIFEKRNLNPAYKTGPFFDSEQDEYEKRFFDEADRGVKPQLPDVLEKKAIDVYSVNQEGMKEYLNALRPDIIWVYGTGRIKPHIIEIPKWGMINLHGGISQKYRGLDSILWAMYYNDFNNLGLTVNYVVPELDTGNILMQEYLKVSKDDEIYHYRYKMTLLATSASIELLKEFEKNKAPLLAKPQVPGNYYSLMPLEKKWTSFHNFKKYREEL